MGSKDRLLSPDGILSAARAVKLFSPLCPVEDEKPVPFHSMLRRLRERVKIPQWKLAAGLGVSQSAVARWETGESLPRRDVFFRQEADPRVIGTGPLEDFSFRLHLSLSVPEWEKLVESYGKAESSVLSDPRRRAVRSLSRLGSTYNVRPRTPRKPPTPSTSRVKRHRAVSVLKDAFVLDMKGNPVSDELLQRLLASAREADSLFLLSGLNRRSGNEVYGGFRKKVLRAALELFDRNARKKAGRPSGS